MDPRFHAQLCSAESVTGSSLAADTLGASLQTSAISASNRFAEADGIETRTRRHSLAYRRDDLDRGEPFAAQVSISRGPSGFLVMSSLEQDPIAGRRGSQASVQRWLDGEPAYSDDSLIRPRSPMDQDGPDGIPSMAPQSQDSGDSSGSSSSNSTLTPAPKPLSEQRRWQPDTVDPSDAETGHGTASAAPTVPSSSTAFGRSSPSISSTTTLVGSDTRSRLSSCVSEDGSAASISTVRAPRSSASGAFLGTMVPPDSDDAESSGSNGVASSSQHTRTQDAPSHDADVASHDASGSLDRRKKRAGVNHGNSDSDQDCDFVRRRKRRRADDDERYNAARKTLRTVLYGTARAHEQGDEVVESLDAIARIFELDRALHHERMTKSSLISQLHMAQKQVEERDREIEEHEAFWSENASESSSSDEQDEDQHSNWSNAGSDQELEGDGGASEDGRVVDVFI